MHIFETTDRNLRHRNGRTVTVRDTRGNLCRVRFADGFEVPCFRDEVAEVKPTAHVYRDTL